MPTPFMYRRNIDLLEDKRAMVYTKPDSPYKGKVLVGKGDLPCMGTDKNGDDVDGVIFNLDSGGGYILTEEVIERVEFLD